MSAKTLDTAEQEIFEQFAAVYPHESYASWPERFMEFAMRKTGKNRAIILACLEETREVPT